MSIRGSDERRLKAALLFRRAIACVRFVSRLFRNRPSGVLPSDGEFAKQWRIVEPEFDERYYRICNPDVDVLDPLAHFLDYGWREGRDPHVEFSLDEYVIANPDVASANINPFFHYLAFGRAEGRPIELDPTDWLWQKKLKRAMVMLDDDPLSEPPQRPPGAKHTISHVQINCPTFMVQDGYGNAARNISTQLERLGIAVGVGGGFSNPSTTRGFADVDPERKGDALILFWTPPSWRKSHWRKTIGFTMFESTSIPDQWIDALTANHGGHVDEVWVPSTWCAEVFRQYTPDPKVIPLGVDASSFPERRRQRGAKLRFLHDSTKGGDVRKGQQLAIDAFQAAFPNRPDVELVLRCTLEGTIDTLELRGDSRIQVTVGRVSTHQLNLLYGEMDAMLYPSRSEGFGLIPLQAMASGMPCIFPTSSGMLDYAAYGLTVEARRVPAQIGAGCTDILDWTFADGNAWYEPDFEQLVSRLRQVDDDYDAVQDRAMANAAKIAKEWTWEASAQAIIARLEA